LADAGSTAEIIVLDETARTAQDAADSIGCALGAIVKSLVFRVGDAPVMALVAGDRRCDTTALPVLLNLEGRCRRADADFVRDRTGFAIGGVAPVGLVNMVPVAIDGSLERFDAIYAAAGHPYCVFATGLSELQKMTGGKISALSSAM
jgi:prolyl-tRNA editing enzyme YbaK/EbsC (Cys-tRNA(Pro) deacylase)